MIVVVSNLPYATKISTKKEEKKYLYRERNSGAFCSSCFAENGGFTLIGVGEL